MTLKMISDRGGVEATHAPSTGSVSIIVPCFGQAHFLGQAVASALNQTCKAAEVIVIDDESPDDCLTALARFRDVTYLRQPNAGAAAARNFGAQQARGQYLVFLDADDVLRPTALADGLATFSTRPDAALVHGRCAGIDQAGRRLDVPLSPIVGEDAFQELLRSCFIWSTSTVMMRRDWFHRIGGFCSKLRHCEDFDLYLRTARAGPIVSHAAIVSDYRRHSGGKSHRSFGMLLGALTVLRTQWQAVQSNRNYRDAFKIGLALILDQYGAQASRACISIRDLLCTWRSWRAWVFLIRVDCRLACRLLIFAPLRSAASCVNRRHRPD